MRPPLSTRHKLVRGGHLEAALLRERKQRAEARVERRGQPARGDEHGDEADPLLELGALQRLLLRRRRSLARGAGGGGRGVARWRRRKLAHNALQQRRTFLR